MGKCVKGNERLDMIGSDSSRRCIDMESNRATINDYKAQANKFIRELKNMSVDEARATALNNLKTIGVVDTRGRVKTNIVQGDFFGW